MVIELGGRIELHASGAASVEFNGSGDLPAGSTFSEGVFYWQIQFVQLKFRNAGGGEINRIVVQP